MTAQEKRISQKLYEDCRSTGEIQLNFDMIQGIYGRSFNSKRDPAYNYLCSLVAFFPDKPLDDNERSLIAEYNGIDEYLVYELQQ